MTSLVPDHQTSSESSKSSESSDDRISDVKSITISSSSSLSSSTQSLIQRTSLTYRLSHWVFAELKRWLTSWLVWGWFIASEIIVIGFLFIFRYSFPDQTPKPTPQMTTDFALLSTINLVLISTFFISGIMAASDYSSHFVTTSRTILKHKLSWLGIRYLIDIIVIAIYSALLYSSYWIAAMIIWKQSDFPFNPSIPWWRYIFSLIFLTILLSLCTASASIIFKNWLAGFLFTYFASGWVLLTLLFKNTPHNWHLENFLLSNVITNATGLTVKNPLMDLTQWSLTYWENIGVAIAYALVYIVCCALVVIYWENRNFTFLKNRKSNKK